MKNRILTTLTALLTPLALLAAVLRFMLTPIFVQVEYRLPWFPPDPYGLSQAERLHWAPYALEYLLNDADVSFLGDLTFPDGSPLFNVRELSHMADVKRVTQNGLRLGLFAWIVLIGLGIYAWRTRRSAAFRRGLGWGARLMLASAVLLGVVGAVSFNFFFTAFHALFFEGDSWLFAYSDTLIRLFPIRFWQDAFLWVALLVLAGCAALLWQEKRLPAERV